MKDVEGSRRRRDLTLFLALAGWLIIPFLFSVGFGAFLVARFLFDAPTFVAVVYGILSFFLTCVLVFSSALFYKRADFDFFLKTPAGDSEERRRISQGLLADMRRDSARAQTRKNRGTFYKNGLIVAVYLTVLAVVAREFFDL